MESTSNSDSVSKNQQKRLIKEEKWLANAEQRKTNRKQKKLAKKSKKKELAFNQEQIVSRRPTRLPQESTAIKIIIDLDFVSYMRIYQLLS
jgi:hypothetical protein